MYVNNVCNLSMYPASLHTSENEFLKCIVYLKGFNTHPKFKDIFLYDTTSFFSCAATLYFTPFSFFCVCVFVKIQSELTKRKPT